MLDFLSHSTHAYHHFLTGKKKKQKLKGLFINNAKLKEYKRFNHGRVSVAGHCLNQPQMHILVFNWQYQSQLG